jgi:NADPH-dependent curcumin reductase
LGISKLAPIGGMSVRDVFGILAIVAPTAYLALTDIGRPKANETLVVSTAAGGVGSVAAQLGKSMGCRVVGLAGTAEKCTWLSDELKLDAVINYKTENIAQALAQACPKGIDIYFDNTGGEILDACLRLMNINGRVVTCGLISDYNAEGNWSGPKNYNLILMQRLQVQGFICLDHLARFPEAIAALVPMLVDGRIKYRLDVVDGFENAVTALNRLYSGENRGKQLVAVHPL